MSEIKPTRDAFEDPQIVRLKAELETSELCIKGLEGNLTALESENTKFEADLAQRTKERGDARTMLLERSEQLRQSEADAAAMRLSLKSLQHADGCYCEASFSMAGCHPSHSQECRDAMHALSGTEGTCIIARLEALEKAALSHIAMCKTGITIFDCQQIGEAFKAALEVGTK